MCTSIEFCNVCEPFFVWFIRMEVSVEQVLCYILWILCMPCAAVGVILDGGLDAFNTADAENAFVIHIDMVIVP